MKYRDISFKNPKVKWMITEEHKVKADKDEPFQN